MKSIKKIIKKNDEKTKERQEKKQKKIIEASAKPKRLGRQKYPLCKNFKMLYKVYNTGNPILAFTMSVMDLSRDEVKCEFEMLHEI